VWQSAMGCMDPIEVIIKEYKRSGTSLRSFSKHLDISPSTLSKILSRKRGVPKAHAKRFAQKLVKDSTIREDFVEAVLKYKTSNKTTVKIPTVILDQNQSAETFMILSQWEYFAILNVLKLKKFDHSIPYLSYVLNISLPRVKTCLDVLLKNKFISIKDGMIKRTLKNIHTSNDVLSRALKMAHLEELELAKSKIDIDIDKKDYQSMTFTLAKKDIPKLKKIIDRMITDVEKITDQSVPEEVYILSTQLFPLSNTGSLKSGPVKKRDLKKHEH
jgi:uncharacterized protein (TIGR02147 family)